MLSISDFLPFYSMNSDTLNDEIYHKREFHELILEEEMETKPEKGQLLKHQEIIARFLSSQSLYDELLVYHDPGTGKSCTAIGVIERVLFSKNTTIKHAYILVKNEDLVRRFTEEIIYVCTGGKYLPLEEEIERNSPQAMEALRFKRARRALSAFYSIETHEKFYNRIKNTSPSQYEGLFSNSIFVIDEIQNLTGSMMYEKYHLFLHSIRNRKIMLLSGTPMRDKANEFGSVMNLLLPFNLQLPTEEGEFNEMISTPEGENHFIQTILGRTSFLRAKTIPKHFMGETIYPITFHPLYGNPMSVFQWQVYSNVQQDHFGLDAQQASLFVYPNGSYGSEGYNQYIQISPSGRHSLAPELKQLFVDKTIEEKLEIIQNFSSKFASAIQHILEYPTQNCFVFTESITGSGAILFGLLLELFHFTSTRGEVSSAGLRYSILSDELHINLKGVLKSFNQERNKNGDYIQVLIGGRKVSEGFSFMNIQQIHILTPHWNFSVIEQAIARGIRAFSHIYLPEGTDVRIYLHVSLPPDGERGRELIDIKMYQVAQEKDKEMKKVESLVQMASFDCALNRKRNQTQECFGIPTFEIPFQELDESSYVPYLMIQDMIIKLQRFFRKEFYITYPELKNKFQDKMVLYKALSFIIQSNIIFYNQYGFECVLRQSNDIFYLTEDGLRDTFYLDAFYTQYPTLYPLETFHDIIQKDDVLMSNRIDEIRGMTLEHQKEEILQLSLPIQELFLENAILAPRKNNLVKWILTHYENYLMKIENILYSTLLASSYKIMRKQNKDHFETIPAQEIQRILETPLTENNPYGYYGILSLQEFKIIDLSLPSRKGLNCHSFKKSTLGKMMYELKIERDAEISKKEARNILRKNTISYESWTEEEMKNVGYWVKEGKEKMCEKIKEFLKEKNLMKFE